MNKLGLRSHLLAVYSILFVISLSISVPTAAQEPPVDLALVLAIDVSFSVDANEFRQQMQGLGNAFRQADIKKAIRNGSHGQIAVAAIQWSDADYQALLKSLKKRPLNYFKEDFYADTAVFTSDAATELGMKFYPLEKIVLASDCPFDPEKGTMYIRETLRIIDALDLTKEQRDQVYYGNLERITGARKICRGSFRK